MNEAQKRRSEMFLQDRKHFRFRFHFSRVLLLAFLLVSPTQGGNSSHSAWYLSCVEVKDALMETPHVIHLFQDPKFVMKLVDCFQAMYKQIQEGGLKTVQDKIPKEVQDLLKNLPDLMKKLKDFALKGGLVVLSVYLLYKTSELFDRAQELERRYKINFQEFKVLQEELIPITAFIDKEILPEWKKGNTANMVKGIEKLIEKLSRNLNVLKELVYRINENIKQGNSDRIWSVTYSIFAVGACVGSIFTGNPWVIAGGCGFGLGTGAFCYLSYNSLSESLEKSDVLWKDTVELRIEVTKYRTFLELVKMKDELYK